MESALIVSASPKGAARIEEWLGPGVSCTAARTEAQAREALAAASFDLRIVNAPLADGDGESLCRGNGVYALLIVPQAQYDAIRARMEPLGVLTLPRPISPQLFSQAISLLRATRARLSRLQARLSETPLIERAKAALMLTLHMSEAEAHRYIEKQAMDQRQPRRAIAEQIVRTYEL